MDTSATQHLLDGFHLQDCEVLPRRNLVIHDDTQTRLEPKIMQVLVYLAAHQGQTVTRETLHQAIWPDSFVTSKTLIRAIGILRKIFADNAREPHLIETISKQGYRLIPEVKPLAGIPPTAPNQPHTIKKKPLWLLGAAILGGLCFYWMVSTANNATAPSRTLEPAKTFTSLVGHELRPTLSPDGEHLAFAWSGTASDNWDIYLQNKPGVQPKRLTHKTGLDVSPAWSPDGQRLAYLHFGEDDSGIFLTSLKDGETTKLAPCFHPRIPNLQFIAPRLAWSPQGDFLAFPANSDGNFPLRLSRINLEDGSNHVLTKPGSQIYGDMDPSFSPNGRFMAFTRFKQWQNSDLWVLDLETGQEIRLTRDDMSILGHTWTPDSKNIVFSSNRSGSYQLWELPAAGGKPSWVPAKGEYLKYPTMSSQSSHLSYENWQYDTNFWIVTQENPRAPQAWIDVNSSAWDDYPDVHRQTKEAVFISNRDGHREIWHQDLSTNTAKKLSSLAGDQPTKPTWSPNGERILYQVNHGDVNQIFTMSADGKQAIPIAHEHRHKRSPSWSPDGKSILYAVLKQDTWNIWQTHLASGRTAAITTDGGYFARMDADQSHLYFTRLDKAGIWRKSFKTGTTEKLIEDCAVGDWGSWLIDEQRIYYLRRSMQAGTALVQWDIETGSGKTILELDGWLPLHQPSLTWGPYPGEFLLTKIDKTQADAMVMSWPNTTSSLQTTAKHNLR